MKGQTCNICAAPCVNNSVSSGVWKLHINTDCDWISAVHHRSPQKGTISGPPAWKCIHLHANQQNKKQTRSLYGFGSLEHCSCICVEIYWEQRLNRAGWVKCRVFAKSLVSSSEIHTCGPHGRKDARLWGADGFILRILTSQQAEVGPGYLWHDQEHHMREERCWNWTVEGLISSPGKNQGSLL